MILPLVLCDTFREIGASLSSDRCVRDRSQYSRYRFRTRRRPVSGEDDQVIETLAPSRSDKPFDVRILPGRVRSGQHVGHGYRLRGGPETGEREISIMAQVPRGGRSDARRSRGL